MKWVDLHRWVEKTAWDEKYWDAVDIISRKLKSDGCTFAPEWRAWTCREHDIHRRTSATLTGQYLTLRQQDWILRRRIQQASEFGAFSPHAWTWWLFARIGSHFGVGVNG